MGDESGKASPLWIRRMVYRNRFLVRILDSKAYFASTILAAFLFLLLLIYTQWPAKREATHHLSTGSSRAQVRKDITPDDLPLKNPRLFYNRVPKCGSSTLNALLKQLAVKNGFSYASSPLLDEWMLAADWMQVQDSLDRHDYALMLRNVITPQGIHFTNYDLLPDKIRPHSLPWPSEEPKPHAEDTMENFIKEFMALPWKSAFDRHLFFLDFSKFEMHNPIYINMIRDPTDRWISEFYFRRRLQNEGVKKRGEKKWYDEDLENCVRTAKDYDCRLVDGTYIKNMLAFFCGHELECSKHNSRWALDRAKSNVEKYFTVVGVLEELDLTLEVLESKVPQFFSGAKELYASRGEHVVNKGANRKQDVSQEIKDILRKNLTAEYEFYDFIRTKLHQEAGKE